MHFMHPRRARLARILFAVLSVSPLVHVLGCQTPADPSAGQQALSQIQLGANAQRNEFGLHRVNIPEGQGILYVKAPRPHLERFDRLLIDSVRLEPDEGDLPWKPSTTIRLQRSFTRTLTSNLGQQSTWRLTDESGPGVLGMRVKARKLRFSSRLPHVSASPSARTRSHDKTTLVMELYDSATGDVLVQFIQRRDLPKQIVGGSRSRVDRLRVYYSRFATSMGDSLAELAQAVEDVRAYDMRQSER